MRRISDKTDKIPRNYIERDIDNPFLTYMIKNLFILDTSLWFQRYKS